MSEYQFYEFKSIDKTLTQKEKEIISSWSSRSEATNSGAIFSYNYSDFSKDELEVVEKYFDAMFYIANWGTRRLIFKIPNEFIDKKKLKQYCVEGLEIYDYENFILIDIWLEDEEGERDWIEGEGVLSSLITLRNDIISGDYRSLYLIWLKVSTEDVTNDYGNVDAESEEPNIPNGLKSLNGSLMEFVDIFDINRDTISAAAAISEDSRINDGDDYSSSLANMTDNEKEDWLIRLIKNEPLLSEKIKRRLKDHNRQTKKKSKRTVSDIIKDSLSIKEERNTRKRKEREEIHRTKLKNIEDKKDVLWEEVYSLINQKQTRAYDEAVKILSSLKELSIFKQDFTEFKEKVELIKQENNNLSGLKRRIDAANLFNK
ncbi:MAG: hypothetical protein N4A72_17440 [Bacteroidales bacterium]|jgi:hypothetical protein|nr:hypothetical protein [Bacteroidales bacterium]